MTITVDADALPTITSKAPDANGSYRNVWFVGDDLVVKRDRNHYGGEDRSVNCESEHNNGMRIRKMRLTFQHNKEKWTIQVPETMMFGPYLVMQRINLPHPHGYYECPQKMGAKNRRGHYLSQWERHQTCADMKIMEKADKHLSEKAGIGDVHEKNVIIDHDNRIVWLIDFAQ